MSVFAFFGSLYGFSSVVARKDLFTAPPPATHKNVMVMGLGLGSGEEAHGCTAKKIYYGIQEVSLDIALHDLFDFGVVKNLFALFECGNFLSRRTQHNRSLERSSSAFLVNPSSWLSCARPCVVRRALLNHSSLLSTISCDV